MARPIADYAIIGDTHSCALIASDGAVEWLCWPRHDSPALLTRLLDEPGGGAATLDIAGARPAARRYRDDSAILETLFAGATGRAMLADFMPVAPPAMLRDTGPDGDAQSRVVRLLRCTEGRLSVRFALRVTPDYGAAAPHPIRHGAAWRIAGEGITLHITGSHPIAANGDTIGMAVSLTEGEEAFLAITLVGADEPPRLDTLADARAACAHTEAYWSDWCARLRYDGGYRDIVVRSAITLKLLTYSPTGAIIAAATSSLPEAVPGDRNFDYRYSWVRDASFIVTAFCNVGLVREAAEYLRFLRDADGTGGARLKLLYGIDGAVPEERVLAHLPGWRGIGPVRIGNAADGQQQHDIYGEFMVALHAYLDAVDYDPPADLGAGIADLVRTLAGHAIRCRHEPDRGIWEQRSAPLHLQHSKAMLWVALDRAAKIAEHLPGFERHEIARWRSEAAGIHAEFERETWNAERGAYMQSYRSDVLDAAVLRTVLFGALPADSPRMRATLAAIERELCDDDLVYRYRMDDGLAGEEASFTACAFWRVGVLALAGETARSTALFERLLARANDVGLFAEEIDAATGEQRGNVPQGFTHMCVINHAIRLERAIAAKRQPEESV